MSEYKETLIDVRTKIAHPQNWCQYSYAVTDSGKSVSPNHPDACRFCLSGAMQACYASDLVYKKLARNLDEDGYIGIIQFNDTHTHDQILAYLDKQIEKAE